MGGGTIPPTPAHGGLLAAGDTMATHAAEERTGSPSVSFPDWPNIAQYQAPGTPSSLAHFQAGLQGMQPGSPKPKAYGFNGASELMRSSSSSLLEPLRQGVQEGSFRPGSSSMDPHVRLPAMRTSATGQSHDSDMIKRLKDTQALLARFSEENSRLAKENDRLRTNRQMLSAEHADVLDEIESLKGKLSGLETAVLNGSQSPTAIKAMLSSLRSSSAAAATARAAVAAATGSPADDRSSTPTRMSNLNPGMYSPSQGGALYGVQSGPGGMPELMHSDSPNMSNDNLHQFDASGMGQQDSSLATYAGQYLRKSSQDMSMRSGSASPSPFHPPQAAHHAMQQQPPPPQQQPQQQMLQSGQPARPPSIAGPLYNPQPPAQPHPATPSQHQTHQPQVANVLTVNGTPNARSRQGSNGPLYGKPDGRGGSKADPSNDSIIIADKAKLALLLGE